MEPASNAALLRQLSEDGAIRRPLLVNMERALVRADIVWESILQLLRRQPWLIFALPIWLLGGRARLRREAARRIPFDPAALPYRTELIEMLRASADRGRTLVLAAEGEAAAARGVADHLALFHDTVVSGEGSNGKADGHSLQERFAATGFDYVGGSTPDLPVMAAAQRGYLVGAGPAVISGARELGDKVQVLSTRPSRARALFKVVRPHQWMKNALVVVPVLLAEHRPSLSHLVAAIVAAISFSLCASAGYVFNDLLDVEADRAHRTKCRRPFAAGDLPVVYGPPLFMALIAASFGLAVATLPLGFLGMLGIYFVATLAYSFFLKSVMMLDVVVLAWLYTHRVLAGGIATHIPISAWLLAFSMFIFSSLAFAKRYIELRQSSKGGQLKSRGYHTQDLEMVASMGPTAGYIAVLVFCLYVDSPGVTQRYHSPMLLWFVCPVLLYWISRVWFLSHRGLMQDDPVKFALTDRNSWLCAGLVTLIAALARFFPR
jgi:4-hydroxybenzoate polyprenyltransferase